MQRVSFKFWWNGWHIFLGSLAKWARHSPPTNKVNRVALRKQKKCVYEFGVGTAYLTLHHTTIIYRLLTYIHKIGLTSKITCYIQNLCYKIVTKLLQK